MHEFRKIVVGLELDDDGDAVTAGSHKAAQQAIWVARANGGEVHLVHSTHGAEYHDRLAAGQELVHAGLSQAGIGALEAMVEEARNSGVEARLDLREGRPWLEITRLALADRADLVVVGKRNACREGGRRLGTVAVKLLRKCPCPVWVVRPAHDLVHRLVLAATDLTPVGDLAVAYGAFLAERHACNLHVVHAWQMPMSLAMRAVRLSPEELEEEIDAIRRQVNRHIRFSLPPGFRCPEGPTTHLSKGSPAQVIREAVAHLDPDLLVMGSISRGGIAGLLIGSTAERLLDRVDCSILAIKPDDFVSPVTLD